MTINMCRLYNKSLSTSSSNGLCIILTALFLSLLVTHQVVCQTGGLENARTISGGLNTFAIQLEKALSKAEGNVAFSPLPVYSALAALYMVANKEVSREMKNALAFPASHQALFHGLRELYIVMTGNPNITFHSVRDLYLGKDCSVSETFRTVRGTKGIKRKARAAVLITSWLVMQTRSKLRHLLQREILQTNTALDVLSMSYFNGKWAKKFVTKKDYESFYVNSSKSVAVDVLIGENIYSYTEDNYLKAKIVKLLYEGNRLSMLVFLPDDKNGLNSLICNLDRNVLNNVNGKLTPHKLHVYLPKFAIDTEIKLDNILVELGIKIPFRKGDFGKICPRADKVEEVLHHTILEIDDRGAEEMKVTSYGPTLEVRVRHPFMFLIQEERTKSIIFMGTVRDPTKW